MMESPEQPPLRRTIESGVMIALLAAFLVVSVLRHNLFGGPAHVKDSIGVIVAAALTLVMYSFLYRDNPMFKSAENLYVGVALGYQAVITWRESLRPEIFDAIVAAPTPEAMREALIHRSVPILLGFLLLTRLSRKYSWLSRYTYALMIGWGAGLGIVLTIDTYILQQLEAAAKPLQDGMLSGGAAAFSWPWWCDAGAVAGAVAVLVGTVCVLFYFFFSVRHGKAGSAVSKVGIWFLMISFGASYGYTVMGRLSLLIGRVRFLMFEWLKTSP
ncbi:MAG: hypothetical protein NTV86_09200 [Planctomycetota bacterium]|nr:hypothetical protein [Planctomycetota bacterium]